MGRYDVIRIQILKKVVKKLEKLEEREIQYLKKLKKWIKKEVAKHNCPKKICFKATPEILNPKFKFLRDLIMYYYKPYNFWVRKENWESIIDNMIENRVIEFEVFEARGLNK